MNTVTGQDIHDSIFLEDENCKALDGLLLALAEDNKYDTEKFLDVLRKSAKSAHYIYSGQMAQDDWQYSIDYYRQVSDIQHDAMM